MTNFSKLSERFNTDWLLNFGISAQENRMVKFEGIRWIVFLIQLNYLEKALRESAGQHNEYLQKLLDFCTFLKNPQRTEPFTEVYEDCVSYLEQGCLLWNFCIL